MQEVYCRRRTIGRHGSGNDGRRDCHGCRGRSVCRGHQVLHEVLDFAFLDVDVTNSKTFEVAQILERKNSCLLTLRSVPFIPKPCYPAQIERLLHAIVD
jgi:hypothetical protein